MSGSRQSECKVPALIRRLQEARRNAVTVRASAVAQRARMEPALHATSLSHVCDDRRASAVFPAMAPLATSLVTIGGSAGATDGLLEIVAALPTGFPAAVVVGLHGGGDGGLLHLLRRHSNIPVLCACAREMPRAGHVYLGPPQHHVVVNADTRVAVSMAARRKFFRPSIDWLFHSAAAAFRERHIAVILSGRMTDGSEGAREVIRSGGVVYAQEPSSCRFSDMPQAAIAAGCVSQRLSARELATAISQAICGLDTDESRWLEPFAS
jgi:chemotaxis response regulator CheB